MLKWGSESSAWVRRPNVQPQQPQQQPPPRPAMEVRVGRVEAQVGKVTALFEAMLRGQPVQAAAPEKPPMPELQELSMQLRVEQFKQTKEAEDKALKAEIKKLQQEAEAYRARVTMYEEVHTKTFNEDRALRERNRWLETQLEDVRASAFQTDFLTPVKVSLLPVGHMASLSAGGSTRISSGAKFQRQLRRTKAQEEAAFVPTNRGAFPFEELVPSKPAVESAAADCQQWWRRLPKWQSRWQRRRMVRQSQSRLRPLRRRRGRWRQRRRLKWRWRWRSLRQCQWDQRVGPPSQP